jgi:hypothetical protein
MGDRIEKLELDTYPPPDEDVEIISMLFKTNIDTSQQPHEKTPTDEAPSCDHTHEAPPSPMTEILALTIVFVVLCSPQFNTLVEKLTKDKNYGLIIKVLLFILSAYLYKSGYFF